MTLKKATGTQGSWYAKIDGVSLPCVHEYWLVNGMGYHDPFKRHVGARDRVQKYADDIAALGQVILTRDTATLDENGDVSAFKRTGYVGVFSVGDVSYSPAQGLTLRMNKRLYSLRP